MRTRRDTLVAAIRTYLPNIDLTRVPDGELHLWARLPLGTDDTDLAARARRLDVIIEPGRPYFIAEPPATHLRFCGTPPGIRTRNLRIKSGILAVFDSLAASGNVL